MDVRDIPLSQLPRQSACPEGQIGVAVADFMGLLNEQLYRNALALVPQHMATHEVLEVGFGCGRFRQLLKEHHPELKWVGLEKSGTMVKIARQLPGYEVQHGVAEHLPFDNLRFGAVVALNTLCWWDEPMIALVEIQRVLAPQGALIISLVLPNEITKIIEQGAFAPRYYEPHQITKMIELVGLTVTDSVVESEELHLDANSMNRSYMLIVARKPPHPLPR